MRMELDVDRVADGLGMGPDAEEWLKRLADVGPPPEPVRIPGAEEARMLLTRLDVPAQDREEIVASLPALAADPVLRWLLDRVHHSLVLRMGRAGQDSHPSLPCELGDAARWFHVHVFLVTVPAVRRFHAGLGIPEELTWHTLAQLGEMVAIHRRKFGTGGMNTQNWLTLHLRGVIHRLGRLQFEQAVRDGEPVLSVHIPERGGALTPEACDDSFRRARPFFAAHLPEQPTRIAVCHSWLLDPQLAEYLRPDSNVVRFMRRWQLHPEGSGPATGPQEGDDLVMEFVFRRVDQSLDQLPQRTSLERAAVAHLRSGRHWQVRSGWVELP